MKANIVWVLASLVWVAHTQSLGTVKLRIVNSAKVTDRTLAEAERMAASVLAQAGVKAAWLDCSAGELGACALPLRRTEFWIHVALWKPADSSAEGLGFAVPGNESGALAGVYIPMVKDMAARFQLDEASILGAALAHEIGHLLGAGHAPVGVMSPQFRRMQIVEMTQGRLAFTASQGAEFRAKLAERR